MTSEDILGSFEKIWNATWTQGKVHCSIIMVFSYRHLICHRNQADNQKYLDHAVAYLKGKAQGTADASPRVVAIAEGSTLIAKKLVDVLEKLSNLILDLEKDPRYQKEKFHSITMGITGVLILAGGLLVIFTPMFWVCPFMIEHGEKLMIVGGAAVTLGAIVTYKGFSKTLLDSSIKAAIQEYLNTKLKNIERMKMPVLDFNEYATKLQQFVESEIPGGVTEVSLAGYIESFEIMRATYMNEQPALGLKQKVNRFLEKRAPLLLAMTGASAVTCSASVVASRVRSLLAPELYVGIISDQYMHT